VRLTVKTLPEREAALQAFFAQHHPYELPQFTAVRMQASPDYFAWIRSTMAA
jgi:periplasmic divalent cation tolerance protein